MPSLAEGVIGSPITHGEMQAILGPMQDCLQRLERTMQELATTQQQRRLSHPGLAIQNIRPQISQGSPGTSADKVAAEDRHTNSLPPGTTPPGTNCVTDGSKADAACTRDKSGGNADEPDPAEDRRPVLFARAEIDKALKADGLGDSVPLFDKLAWRLERCARWWNKIKEPERNNLVYSFAESRIFEAICLLIIIINSAVVAYAADWQVRNIGVDEPEFLETLETCFFFWFVFELLVRLGAHRMFFFLNSDMQWNIFDFLMVSLSVIHFLTALIANSKAGSNVGFMRMLRLLKLAKIFRSLRAFRFVKALEMMLESLTRSFVSLFWGLVMLAFILYLFSLIFVQAVIDYLSSDEFDAETMNIETMNKFGSLGRTFLSLYMAVTGGDDWGVLYDILSPTGWVYGILLVFFTFFFIFALFNILTGCLIEKAIAVAKPERTEKILKQRKRMAEEKHTFLQLCKSMDRDGDGIISNSEFQKWMRDPIISAYMSSMGIDVYDAELFFQTVGARDESGDKVEKGTITIPHFVEGCMHMKGSATALDMQRQLFETHVMHHDLKRVEMSLSERLQVIEQLLFSNLQ